MNARRLTALELVAVLFLAVLSFGTLAFAADSPPDRDEELLQESGVKIEAKALTALLRERSPEGVDLKGLERLIGQMASDDFATREKASRELMKWGQFVRVPLEKAAKDEDPELAQQAKAILKKVNREIFLAQPLLAVRVLTRRWPNQAIAPLLHHLPFAEGETADEIVFSLYDLVKNQERLPEVLIQTLEDKEPARRAAAAVIIGRRGKPEERAAAAKLLKDDVPMVRLRAAQGLLAARDKSGLPTLVSLLSKPDVAVSWSAEELMHWAAGDTAPEAVIGAGTVEERRACYDAWEAWLEKEGARVDLDKRYEDPRRPGLLIVISQEKPSEIRGRKVWLRGCDGKPRWQLKSVVTDAELLPGNRVLICRWQGPVMECDLEGGEIWKATVDVMKDDFHCYRLPNGRTFAGCQALFYCFETDASGRVDGNDLKGVSLRDGESPFLLNPPQKLPDGRIVWVDKRQGLLCEFDPETARVVKEVPFDPTVKVKSGGDSVKQVGVSPVEFLANGHCLLSYMPDHPDQNDGKWKPGERPYGRFVEVNGAGKVIWECPAVRWPVTAARLRNGHTVVYGGLPVTGLAEVDRAGKKFWEDFSSGRVVRLRQCLPLVRLGFDEPIVPVDLDTVEYRLKGLKDKDASARYRSVIFLQYMGHKAEPAVPALLEALGDPEKDVRRAAESTLMDLGRPAFLAAVEALSDNRPLVRANAIMLVGYLNGQKGISPEDVKAAAVKVLDAARDREAIVRRKAMYTLGSFSEVSDEAIPAMIRALKDKDVPDTEGDVCVSTLAASYLGTLRHPTPEVMPALIEAAQAPEGRLRYSALIGVGRLAAKDRTFAPEAVEALRAALRGKDSVRELNDIGLRAVAAAGLGMLKDEAKSAVPDLIEALRAEGAPDAMTARSIRLNVIGALRDIGPEARAAVPHLLTILRSKDYSEEEHKLAVEALKRIDPETKVP